jgi:phosphoglycolate phosphatase-like HAD superfamily hydrolase
VPGNCIQKYGNQLAELFETGKLRLIILDFDGVIVESNDIKDRVFRKIFDGFPEYSEELWQYHRTYVSVSRYQKFDYLLEKIGRKDDRSFKTELLNSFSSHTLELMKTVPFVKGAKEFLDRLSVKLPLYLASVTPIEDLDIILDNLGIGSYFKAVYGCPPWTKPNAVRDILKRENTNAESAVLIGDSYGDQRAAKETGVQFIGRDSGLGFEEPYPSIVVPDLDGLLKLF